MVRQVSSSSSSSNSQRNPHRGGAGGTLRGGPGRRIQDSSSALGKGGTRGHKLKEFADDDVCMRVVQRRWGDGEAAMLARQYVRPVCTHRRHLQYQHAALREDALETRLSSLGMRHASCGRWLRGMKRFGVDVFETAKGYELCARVAVCVRERKRERDRARVSLSLCVCVSVSVCM